MQNLDNEKRREFIGNGAKALASMGILGLMSNVAFGATKSHSSCLSLAQANSHT